MDPTGHVPLELRDVVKEHRGRISWDEDTKTATATIGKITKSYKIDDCVVKDGHIMLQSSQIARDFGLNQTLGVEGRHTLAQTDAYLSSGEAKTAYRLTGKAVATGVVVKFGAILGPLEYASAVEEGAGAVCLTKLAEDVATINIASPPAGTAPGISLSVISDIWGK